MRVAERGCTDCAFGHVVQASRGDAVCWVAHGDDWGDLVVHRGVVRVDARLSRVGTTGTYEGMCGRRGMRCAGERAVPEGGTLKAGRRPVGGGRGRLDCERTWCAARVGGGCVGGGGR